MDDGVRLAIDVYLPRNLEPGTRLPTILEQTRYRRSLEPRPELRDSLDRPGSRTAAFVTRGYAYVVVDVRGSGASFGSRNIELGPIEVGDGNEVVDWIIRQPWSNGAVGATGISYVGSTAELLLVNRHPAVRAIVPQFTSAPLAQDMEVTGHPIVTLFVNSTASDGAFFVYLEEVDESGHVRYVTEGALRAIHRKRSDDPPAYATIIPHRTYRRGDAMPLVPGQIAELTFDLLPTSYLFREGRRIRVAIAGADIDHFPAIPAIPPTVHVLRDREHPSRIHLPVIP